MDSIEVARADGTKQAVPVTWTHTLVIGSGAAGLNAAVQLRRHGIEDVLIVTEGLEMGTSINTGSDKQTYYKLSLYGSAADSPAEMAADYFRGGSMHGDLALVEGALSARAFLNLVNLGLPFPRDRHGQFVGYTTDHDLRGRATSIGPYTSREMCRALITEVKRLGIPVREKRTIVSLVTTGNRAAGAAAVGADGALELYGAENVVFCTGGPGGLYRRSVYPAVHTGGIGLALMAGARARNLPESQYGLASTKFRWNVSGTYMQVIPRFVSTDSAEGGNEREFLRDYFASPEEMNSMIFLKGYQWPFDPRRIAGGSSLIDVLVYIETELKGRRVFLDFRTDGEGLDLRKLSPEALEYLTKSEALLDSPLARLKKMNPGAVELYAEHGIDLAFEPLEIAVCAQHNNGGLAGTLWWESENIARLFPLGEVNGSHGTYRPGGSALNSGQVAGFRAAEIIARRYDGRTLDPGRFGEAAAAAAKEILAWTDKRRGRPWRKERAEFQARMSRAGAAIRSRDGLRRAVAEARDQWKRVLEEGCGYSGDAERAQALMTRYLCFAHRVYLEAALFAVEAGIGSRGSSMVLDPNGTRAHPKLGAEWSFAPENPSFREKVLETEVDAQGSVLCRYAPRRPIPASDAWFETAWAAYREGRIYE
jgi:succinate dehydrogenase/fumarate reductase flavoprotein subunit